MADATMTAGTALVALGKRIDVVAESLGDRPASKFVDVPFELLATAVLGAEKTRMALFIAAPHHQGGHSRSGAAIADALGVPFPIDTKDLLAKAREEEINPALLWPWLVEMRPDFFTLGETAEARKPQAEA